jgi:glycerophosphoryl diester phosphodiesterase
MYSKGIPLRVVRQPLHSGLVIVLAHRGLRTHGPENTLAGFQGVADAAARGVPLGIEFDARKTADDVLITVHDADVHFGPDRRHMVYCDDWHSSMQHFLGENCPPRLEDAVKIVGAQVPLIDIDLKERGYTQAVIDACEGVDPARIGISSHIPDVVTEAKKMAPSEFRIGMSVSEFWRFDEEALLELLSRVNADFLFLHYSLVTERIVNRLHDSGKEIGSYTINDQRMLHHFIEMGVDYPCTDNPHMAIDELTD